MSKPTNFHDIPKPHSAISNRNRMEPSVDNASVISKLWRPIRAGMQEAALATLARSALRLIDRTTGMAYSADELMEKIGSSGGSGSNYKGEWVEGQTYVRGDMVWFDSGFYLCIYQTTGTPFTAGESWQLVSPPFGWTPVHPMDARYIRDYMGVRPWPVISLGSTQGNSEAFINVSGSPNFGYWLNSLQSAGFCSEGILLSGFDTAEIFPALKFDAVPPIPIPFPSGNTVVGNLIIYSESSTVGLNPILDCTVLNADGIMITFIGNSSCKTDLQSCLALNSYIIHLNLHANFVNLNFGNFGLTNSFVRSLVLVGHEGLDSGMLNGIIGQLARVPIGDTATIYVALSGCVTGDVLDPLVDVALATAKGYTIDTVEIWT